MIREDGEAQEEMRGQNGDIQLGAGAAYRKDVVSVVSLVVGNINDVVFSALRKTTRRGNRPTRTRTPGREDSCTAN